MKFKYTEILLRNDELEKALPDKKYEIIVFSNIMISQINEILEYYLRKEGIPAIVRSGNYDNIVQDSLRIKGVNLVIIFWELCNLTDDLPSKIISYKEEDINNLLEKTKGEIDFVFRNLEETSLVLCNQFTSLQFPNEKLYSLAKELNQYLFKYSTANSKFIDIEGLFSEIGIKESLDLRNYKSSKALYSVKFYKRYVEEIASYVMSVNGKSKKALIFDCDNTLWKGIVGEDGFWGINMSEENSEGRIFAEIQEIALNLNK